MCAHTHDHVDWTARIPAMRRADLLHAGALADIATRLVDHLPGPVVAVDAGSGTGGMSAALADALGHRPGSSLFLVDAVPELLREAETAASRAGPVPVHTVEADVADGAWRSRVPPAGLVWAAHMVHHLPDQQAGIGELAAALDSGGILAISEGGLEPQCLPWDLGVGEPGLQYRLSAARDDWFRDLRAGMADAVSMPYGWGSALTRAGLRAVSSFSSLIDHPAPPRDVVREFVIERVGWLAEAADDRLGEADRQAVRRLLDPEAPEYLGARDDVFLLGAVTVHYGRKP